MTPPESRKPVTYEGLEPAQNPKTPHLGGSIKVGDPYTYCPTVWDYVISRFCIRSILDVGSGSGNASYYFHKAGLQVVALEGLPASIETSLYPAVLHDLTNGPLKTCVDLVHCQEVLEHIEEQFLDNVLDTLLCGKIILITHALLGQGGFHHVNLQPSFYWIQHLENRSCTYLEADTQRVRGLASPLYGAERTDICEQQSAVDLAGLFHCQSVHDRFMRLALLPVVLPKNIVRGMRRSGQLSTGPHRN